MAAASPSFSLPLLVGAAGSVRSQAAASPSRACRGAGVTREVETAGEIIAFYQVFSDGSPGCAPARRPHAQGTGASRCVRRGLRFVSCACSNPRSRNSPQKPNYLLTFPPFFYQIQPPRNETHRRKKVQTLSQQKKKQIRKRKKKKIQTLYQRGPRPRAETQARAPVRTRCVAVPLGICTRTGQTAHQARR